MFLETWVPLFKKYSIEYVWEAISDVRAKETMKTTTFLIPRVVQFPTGVWQVALQNWMALHKTLDSSLLAARFFFPLFRGLLMNPFLDGWSVVVKNLGLHSALPCEILGPFNISYVLQVAGHVLASSLLEASSLLALLAVTLPRVLVQSLLLLLAVGVLVVLATLPYRSENILHAVLAGFAGRHGEELRAPGGRRATRPLPGALWQARQVDCHIRESSANMSDVASSLVPHARLFSLHPSLVSQNSCLSHGLGAMNSCGSIHGVVMHDNSSGVHVNSWGALGHKNSCNQHAAGVQGRTKASNMSTRLAVGRPAVEKLASPGVS